MKQNSVLFKGKWSEQKLMGLTILRQYHRLIRAGVSCPISLFPFIFCKKGCHMQSLTGEEFKLQGSKELHFPPKS